MEPSVVVVMLGPPPRRTGSRRDAIDYGRAQVVFNTTKATILVLGIALLVAGSCLSLPYVLRGSLQDLVYVSLVMVIAVSCLWFLVYHWRGNQQSNPTTREQNSECSEFEEVQIRDDEPPPYEPSTTPDYPSGRGYRDTTTDLPPSYSIVAADFRGPR